MNIYVMTTSILFKFHFSICPFSTDVSENQSDAGGFFQKFQQQVPSHLENKLMFLGVDLMLDNQENIFLLEMNHGPCFPTTPHHPLQCSLYEGFWRLFIRIF